MTKPVKKSKNKTASLQLAEVNLDMNMIRPNKLRGQNFLIDDNIINHMVEQGNLTGNEDIIEIGPGLGALTKVLIKQAKSLTALEIEDDFAVYLKELFNDNDKVNIIHTDAQNYDYNQFNNGNPYILFGNLPYSITTPLLKKLLLDGGNWQRMILLLQKEAAQRIAYGKGKNNGLLPILAAYSGNSYIAFDVAKECFTPIPSVTSSVMIIERHRTPPVDEPIDEILTLVEAAFSNRRKTLLNCLGNSPIVTGNTDYWRKGISFCGLESNCRAESLSLNDFANLLKWSKINFN